MMRGNNSIRTRLASLGLGLLGLCLAGCQSWSGAGYPFNNPALVPPPGTGTYPVPANYYNNGIGAAQTGSNVSQINGGSGMRAVDGGLPSTDLYTAAQDASVQPATFTPQAAVTPVQNIPTSVVQASTGEFVPIAGGSAATASLNDTGVSDVPSLHWQH